MVYKIIKFLLEMSKWEAGNLSVEQKSLSVKRHTEKRLTGNLFLLKVIFKKHLKLFLKKHLKLFKKNI